MKCYQEEMLALPTRTYTVEMTLRIHTAAQNILFLQTRLPRIFQMFSLLALSIANAGLHSL